MGCMVPKAAPYGGVSSPIPRALASDSPGHESQVSQTQSSSIQH